MISFDIIKFIFNFCLRFVFYASVLLLTLIFSIFSSEDVMSLEIFLSSSMSFMKTCLVLFLSLCYLLSVTVFLILEKPFQFQYSSITSVVFPLTPSILHVISQIVYNICRNLL